MITPNLTAQPVIQALISSLIRGVDVHITINRRMMLFEQLVTAGTITEICMWKLVKAYRRLPSKYPSSSIDEAVDALEAGALISPGNLRIGYFRPHPGSGTQGKEPVKLHIKSTIIDEEVIVLGSGNMDRASWYTSQELGVAFAGSSLVRAICEELEECLVGRVDAYFGSL